MACPVLGLEPAVPRGGRPPVLGLVARRGVPALFSLPGAGTQSLTLAHSLLQIPLSSKVHGVNAIGSSRVARSTAARRRGLPQSRTIRRVVSTWC